MANAIKAFRIGILLLSEFKGLSDCVLRSEIWLGVGACNRVSCVDHVRTEEPALLSVESSKIRPTASDDPSTGLVLTVIPAKFKDTDQLLQRLWDREKTLESSAVTQYLDEYVRLPSGRYQVSLPWKSQECRELGESISQALIRFLQNERAPWNYGTCQKCAPKKFVSKPEQRAYYLPMHGIFKSSLSTTKLRIVFTANSKSSNVSLLNDLLLPKSSLYPMITSIVIKFRSHQIAISGDILKMFR